jgi:hypothetical protein
MIPLVLAMVVSTGDPQAQKLFDRGLTSFYAYDRAGAANAFASALQQDPNLAMAAWGEALAVASDLNHGGNGHGNDKANAHAKVSASVHGKSENHANSSSRGKSQSHTNSSVRSSIRNYNSNPMVASSHGKSTTAHSCINPAGNTRGWCKSHMNGAFITGTVTNITGNTAIITLPNNQEVQINTGGRNLTVGQQVTLRGNFGAGNVFDPTGGNYSNYGGPYSGASVRGLIISVNGNSMQIAQGLSLITINDANAVSRGAISGTLYPGRTITAAGNWNGSVFYANSIQ